MSAKRADLLERIENGERMLARQPASDTKRAGIEKKLRELRTELAELDKPDEPDLFTTFPNDDDPPAAQINEPPFIDVDPRPDLVDDSTVWTSLLKLAMDRSGELCGILNGIRCGGTRIKVGRTTDGKFRWLLKPDIDPSGRLAWETLADYEEARDKYLKPHQADVAALLKELEQYSPPERG